jgi:ADP-ribose pyrophosphatase
MNYFDLIKSHPNLFDNSSALMEIIVDPIEIAAWENKRKTSLEEIDRPKSWTNIGVVYEDRYIIILRDLVKLPSGKLDTYIRLFNRSELEGGKSVVVLPLYKNKIVLLEQFRHPIRSFQFELPRGFGESNLPAAQNAIKELIEEVQAQIEHIEDIGTIFNNSGIEGNSIHIFLAKLSGLGEPQIDEGITNYIFITKKQFENMIIKGKIKDGFTITA